MDLDQASTTAATYETHRGYPRVASRSAVPVLLEFCAVSEQHLSSSTELHYGSGEITSRTEHAK